MFGLFLFKLFDSWEQPTIGHFNTLEFSQSNFGFKLFEQWFTQRKDDKITQAEATTNTTETIQED